MIEHNFFPAMCPLLAAVFPLRYALGATPAIDTGSLNLPALNGAFPELGEAHSTLREQPLNYTARLLRDGWMYLWQPSLRQLSEFTVVNAGLTETPRGGKVIDPSARPYLILEAGVPAMLAWSPARWSDPQFSSAKTQATTRSRIMRTFTPLVAPHSGPLKSIHGSIGDYRQPDGFNWSAQPSGEERPDWQAASTNMQRCEQQAYAIVDDPWGVWLDLAALIRAQQTAFDARRHERGEDWAIAGVLKSISDNDYQIREQLHAITRQDELIATWLEQEREETRYETDLRRISQLWTDWFATFKHQGPASLDTAAGHFDLALPDERAGLEMHFAAACLGASSCSLSATALSQALDPQQSQHRMPWLIWAVSGLSKRLSLGEIKALLDAAVTVHDANGAVDEAQASLQQARQIATTVNTVAQRLSAYNLAPAEEALFLALAPVAGAHLHNAQTANNVTSLYLGAAMARSQQQMAVSHASPVQIGEWLSDLMETRPAAMPDNLKIKPLAHAVPQALPFFSLVAAPQARSLGSIAALVTSQTQLTSVLDVSKDALEKAPVKSLVVLVAAVNFGWGVKGAVEGPSVKNVLNFVGSAFGVVSAGSAVLQKVAELRWEDIIRDNGKHTTTSRLALTDALGRAANTAALLSVVSGIDAVIYGLETFEDYQRGDFDTALLSAGLSAASAANLVVYVKTFRVFRAARAAVIAGDIAVIGRGLYQAPHLLTKGLGLTLIIVSGLIARLYTKDTPLEQWIKNTRFGIRPADWADSYLQTMSRFYSIVFPVHFDAYRINEPNPYHGMVQSTYVTLRLPGQVNLSEQLFRFEGEEVWAGMFGNGRVSTPVSWTASDFAPHIGSRITNEQGPPVYRRVYHPDRYGMALRSITGKFYYSPVPGVTLPPIDIEELAWI